MVLNTSPQANISFQSSGRSWHFEDRGGYQSRNTGTFHLLFEALKAFPPSQTNSSPVFHVWTDDFPPASQPSPGIHLAYCRSASQHYATLIPDFLFWSWPEVGVPDYPLLISEMERAGSVPPEFEEVFWIGNPRVHQSRQRLLDIGGRRGDAKLIAMEWMPQGPEHLPSDVAMTTRDNRYTSLPDHCRYRFLVDVEGRGYSARLKALLFSRRMVFLQCRPWEEFFFRNLKPHVHYLPVERSLKDFTRKLDWARAHPLECERIAENAYRFARKHLTRDAAVRYLREILAEKLRDTGQ
jgi:hypothetical protein